MTVTGQQVRDRYGINHISYVFSTGHPSSSHWEYTLTVGILSFGVFSPTEPNIQLPSKSDTQTATS